VLALALAGSDASGSTHGSATARSRLPRYGRVQFFAQSSEPGSATVTGATAVADFNGDGLPDVALARALGGAPSSAQDTFPIGVLLNDGHGKLLDQPATIFDGAPPRNQWGRMLLVADFNNDGRPDLFLPDTGPEAANGRPPGYHSTLILSTPDGRLRDATSQIPQEWAFTHSAAAADVNGDGNIDLFVGNIGGNLGGSGSCCDIQIWLNDGRGNFTVAPGRLPPAIGTDNVYTATTLADVNGDGAPDLILAGGHGCVLSGSTQRNDTQVLLNDGRGYFHVLSGAIPSKPFGVAGEAQGIAVADLNQDRHPDLLIAYTSGPQTAPDNCSVGRVQGRYIQVLLGNGDGTFRDETASRLPKQDTHRASFDYIESLTLADLTGDGRPEIFTSLVVPPWGDPTSASAYRNNGKGDFTPLPVGYPVLDSLSNVHAFLDFTGHGRRDVLIIDSQGQGDRFYRRLQLGKPLRPGLPTGVRVTRDPATGQTVIAWPYVWGAARYEIWRSGTLLAVTHLMRYVDSGSSQNSSYTIRAVNSAGKSGFSAIVPAAK